MSDSVRDFLDDAGGASYPAVKFPNVGDAFRGVIYDKPKVVTRPALNPPHDPENQLVINLTVDGSDEPRTLWVRKGFLAQAVAEAIEESGAPGLEIGGTLAVQRTEDKDTGKVQPAHTFKAKYKAPAAAAVSAADVFDL